MMLRLVVLAAVLGGCLDLGIDAKDFACRSGGPCDAGSVASPDGALPQSEDAAALAPDANVDTPTVDAGAAIDAGGEAADAGIGCSVGPSGTWAQLSPTGSIPRAGHTAVVDTTRNRAIIYGGAGSDGRLFALTVAGTPAFTALATTSDPPPRREHATVYAEGPDGIIIFGGIGESGAALDDSWTLRFADSQWIERGPLRTPRYSAAGAMLESIVDYVVLFNGCNDQGPFEDDHQFDSIILLVGPLDTPAPKPSPRCEQSATLVPGWGTAVFGGKNSSALGDLWRLVEDFPNRTWTLISSDGPARSGHTTVFDVAHYRLLVFGGVDETGAKSDQVWAYSLGDSCWGQLDPAGTPPSARSQHAAFMLGGVMYVVGGDDGAARGDLWSLTF